MEPSSASLDYLSAAAAAAGAAAAAASSASDGSIITIAANPAAPIRAKLRQTLVILVSLFLQCICVMLAGGGCAPSARLATRKSCRRRLATRLRHRGDRLDDLIDRIGGTPFRS